MDRRISADAPENGLNCAVSTTSCLPCLTGGSAAIDRFEF